MHTNDSIRARRILKAAQDATAFSQGFTVETLRADRLRALAVIRCLEIVGDTAEHITPAFREAHAKIPWRILVHMRHRLAQLYFSVDLALILETTQQELPSVIADLTAAIAEEEKEDAPQNANAA